MDSLLKLISHFREFPGIGPRQAERFAYFLLGKTDSYRKSLASEITSVSDNIRTCPSCYKFFTEKGNLCHICSSPMRDSSLLMVVAKDVDLNTIEKTKTYNGKYFVLGGTIPILSKEPEKTVRVKELEKTISNRPNLKEIIFALSVNSESEYTREIVEDYIKTAVKEHNIAISVLGRGLSTGTEIEYSDMETIKNALERRTRGDSSARDF